MFAYRFAALVLAFAAGCASSGPTCTAAQTRCGQACYDLTSSHDNCGACDNVCGAAEACVAGTCTTSCPMGQTVCSGSCATLASDGGNCGMCGNACLAGQVCSNSQCTTTCAMAQVACDRSCVDPMTDAGHCGATDGCGTSGGSAGTVCVTDQSCVAGVCTLSCPSNQINCAGSCVDPASDRNFCGASGSCDMTSQGVVCGPGEACSGGVCNVSCPGNQINCAGFCIDPSSDRMHCGASGACDSGTAGTVCLDGELCSAGVCALSCPATQIACNARCVDPLTDQAFCGATLGCGVAGAGSAGMACGAGQQCVAGACTISCPATQLNCGGICVDPNRDNDHCGASGSCDTLAGTAGSTCASGTDCVLGVCTISCPTTQLACDGACVDPTSDRTHCGATVGCGAGGGTAGMACPAGQACVSSVCTTSCPGTQVNCGGVCVDPNSNDQHCGAKNDCLGGNAGSLCAAGSDCVGGVCTLSCPGSEIACGVSCVDPSSDRNHCGATTGCGGAGGGTSGMACPAGQACVSSVCTTSCPGTQVNCGGVCVDPNTDNGHCGAKTDCSGGNSGAVCTAGTVCSGGSCGASCGSPLSNCGGVCVDERNDPSHCGSCVACTNGTQVSVSDCRASTCVVAKCNGGFADCNNYAGDGCETSVAADNSNCGGCNNACTANQACVANVCNPALFDSLTGTVSQSSRTAASSCGTAVSVATTRTITHIAVKNSLNSAGNIKFLVFSHATNTALLITPAQAVPANGDTWKVSSGLSITLTAGSSYDIGAITDVAGNWDYDGVAENTSGITSLVANPNWSNFVTPTFGGSGGADCGIRLY